MSLHRSHFNLPVFALLASVVLLAGCQILQPPGVKSTPAPSLTVTAPEASLTPQATTTVTPTPEPMAARINGEGLPVARLEAELKRFQAANPDMSSGEARQTVIDSLVDEVLLAQAAAENGYELTDEELTARLNSLVGEQGGEEAFNQWLSANDYTADGFRLDLRRSIAASWQRDQIASDVPEEGEQVHARQILVLNQAQADEIYQQLEAGADFATLVVQYDSVTGGDLGWFPKGYLTVPALDEAVFSLQPGEYTPVIQSEFGYHILQVIERKVNLLSPDARLMLQHQALRAWLEQRRSQSTIETLTP